VIDNFPGGNIMPRTSKKSSKASSSSSVSEISTNDSFNIIDILKLDHEYLKDCIECLTDESESPKTKMKYGKGFLDALKKHSAGEKKALYAPLIEVEDFRSNILEGEIEHGIVDQKVKMLIPKLSKAKSLSEELEAELKVLAELVKHHVKEEEEELFEKMEDKIDSDILNQMGFQFMLLREFSEKDLEEKPELMEEMESFRDVKITPAKLLNVTHEYFNSQR
jgi:hemerythrin-like domain-containing protein